MFRSGNDWEELLAPALKGEEWLELERFLENEYETRTVYPPREELFAAFQACGYAQTKVVIIGQDPYHQPGQAHGLSFSVNRGVPLPPSLRNMCRELQDDLGLDMPVHGDLRAWAAQGVLLLNAVLTVRADEPLSHRERGWERFSDLVVQKLSERETPVVFVLWGREAQAKRKWIDAERHPLIESAHPSPLAAHRGFFGSRPFSRINEHLRDIGRAPIDWRLS